MQPSPNKPTDRDLVQLEPSQLIEATTYTSTEPCAMCSGAVHWSGIRRVVCALARSGAAARTSS
ncbi:hypothetical protein [Streptomyces sp. NPDC001450]